MSLSASYPSATDIPIDELQNARWHDGLHKKIITFGIVGGKIRGQYEGLPVYGHRDYPKIEAGESWYCALEQKCPGNYFAIPILKIDSSTLYDLIPEFRLDLADTMLRRFPEQARAVLKDSANCDDQRIDSSEHAHSCDETESIPDDTSNGNPDENTDVRTSERSGMIYRSAPNRLTSDIFTEQRYSVCLSHDRSVMMIQANESGMVTCHNNTIEIYGLDVLLPLSERNVMKTKISKNTGTIWASIEQEPPEI